MRLLVNSERKWTMRIYKVASLLIAAALTLGCVGCGSEKTKEKSKKAKKKTESITVADETVTDELTTDEQNVMRPTAADGKYMKQAYDLLQSKQYTLRLT